MLKPIIIVVKKLDSKTNKIKRVQVVNKKYV